MKDSIAIGGLVFAFAALITVHVAIALGLLFRLPRWRAGGGALLPPLAPYWALRVGMPRRGWLWIASVALYACFLALAAR